MRSKRQIWKDNTYLMPKLSTNSHVACTDFRHSCYLLLFIYVSLAVAKNVGASEVQAGAKAQASDTCLSRKEKGDFDVRSLNHRMLVNVDTAGQLALLSRTWLFVHLIECLLFLTSWDWCIWVIYWNCRRGPLRSAQRFLRVCGLNFGHQSPPLISIDKHAPGA